MSRKTFLCEGGCGRMCRKFHGRKTRQCKICCAVANGQSPIKREKNRIAMTRRHADPAYQAKHARLVAEGVRACMQSDPSEAARRRAAGYALASTGLGHAAQTKGSPPRMRAGRTVANSKIKWCPEHLRDEYRSLMKGGLKMAEAREIIIDRMRREHERPTKRLSFDEQLRRIQAGEVRVTRKFKPARDTGPFTLGGVGSGLL